MTRKLGNSKALNKISKGDFSMGTQTKMNSIDSINWPRWGFHMLNGDQSKPCMEQVGSMNAHLKLQRYLDRQKATS